MSRRGIVGYAPAILSGSNFPMRRLAPIAFVLILSAADAPPRADDRPPFGYDPRADFRIFDPQYRDKKHAASERLRDKLQAAR